MTPLRLYKVEKQVCHVVNNSIKRSTLNRLVRTKSPDIPASIRVGAWSFEWTGKGWVRDKVKDTDVTLLETE